MAYVTQARIQARIPAAVLNDALDDDRDGAADDGILAEICQAASDAVDAVLQNNTSLADPVPAMAKEAAFCFACEMIYDRRPIAGADNPWRKQSDAWRDILQKVYANGIGLYERDRPNASENADGL